MPSFLSTVSATARALQYLDVISEKELEVFEPKLLVIELSAVLARVAQHIRKGCS